MAKTHPMKDAGRRTRVPAMMSVLAIALLCCCHGFVLGPVRKKAPGSRTFEGYDKHICLWEDISARAGKLEVHRTLQLKGNEPEVSSSACESHNQMRDAGFAGNPPLSRRLLLERATSLAVTCVGVASSAAGIWRQGLGDGVPAAEAFGVGEARRPLTRCLVNAVNAQEFSKNLEVDLAAGLKVAESRGLVKGILRDLELKDCLKDAVSYLPGPKRQAALDAALSSIEYLATVVEFDAWDKLDKERTSNVALRNMTPDNINFVRMALEAASGSLEVFLLKFDEGDVEAARDTYNRYFRPVDQQGEGETDPGAAEDIPEPQKSSRREEFLRQDLESMGL